MIIPELTFCFQLQLKNHVSGLSTGPERLASLDIGVGGWLSQRFAQSFLMGISVPVAVLSDQGLVWIPDSFWMCSYCSAVSNARRLTERSLVTLRFF